MFGYVVVNKPELKIKDFDVYQAFYCGLCRSLHRRFGRFAQLSLNYDLTFLAILWSALYEPQTETFHQRCIIHPLASHDKLSNTYIDYAAEMTVVLTYLKCEDDWKDDHSLRGITMRQMLKRAYDEIKMKYPDKISCIEQALTDIQHYEEAQSRDLDKLSSLFGMVMGEIMTPHKDEWESILYELGDYLGRFIYIMDAYDDVVEDKKEGNFNPFIEEYESTGFDERVKTILELMIAKSAEAFEILPILTYTDILRNIIYSGIWTKYEMVRKKRSGEDDGRSI